MEFEDCCLFSLDLQFRTKLRCKGLGYIFFLYRKGGASSACIKKRGCEICLCEKRGRLKKFKNLWSADSAIKDNILTCKNHPNNRFNEIVMVIIYKCK